MLSRLGGDTSTFPEIEPLGTMWLDDLELAAAKRAEDRKRMGNSPALAMMDMFSALR